MAILLTLAGGLTILAMAGCPPAPAAEIPPANLLQVPSIFDDRPFEAPEPSSQADFDGGLEGQVVDAGSENVSMDSGTQPRSTDGGTDGGTKQNSSNGGQPAVDGGISLDAAPQLLR